MKRTRRDLCPGLVRPWLADDGAIVRFRLIGGRTDRPTLHRLLDVAEQYGDGRVLLTSRANVQVRGVTHDDGCLAEEFVDAAVGTGLIPHPQHELVRNVMVSPATGIVGGQADLTVVAQQFDDLLCAEPSLAGLSARFLTVLDDGRGDVLERELDLGIMAVDAEHAQVRIGSKHWGEVIGLSEVPATLVEYARRFVDLRGDAPDAPWHVDELPDGPERIAGPAHARDLRTHVRALPLPNGPIRDDGVVVAQHASCPDGVLTRDLLDTLPDLATAVVVTPWRSLLIPCKEPA